MGPVMGIVAKVLNARMATFVVGGFGFFIGQSNEKSFIVTSQAKITLLANLTLFLSGPTLLRSL